MQTTEHITSGSITKEKDPFLYGVIAEFDEAEAFLEATGKARDAGFKKMDGYSPFPLPGLSEALGIHDKSIPLIVLFAAICGGFSGFGLATYCSAVYPLNIGGRPTFSWPSFLPVTFELTILFAAVVGVISMIALNGLPMPYHPVFDAPNFELATSSRFFLCIEQDDPQFDREQTRQFLESLKPLQVSEVELKK